MTLSALAPSERSLPLSGVASLTTLRPVAVDRVPQAAFQGELALDLGAPELPARPDLTVITGADGELEAFAARFAQAVVDVIAGDRGVHQLMRWTSESVYDDLVRRTNSLQRTTPREQRVRRLRAQVRSVHLFRPHDDAAELSVHVRHGQRSRAIAGRIEQFEGRWRCTVLQFG